MSPAFIYLLFILTSAQGALLSCPKGCIKYGNCNGETGNCECPFGRGGEACEIDLLPACRLSPEAPGQYFFQPLSIEYIYHLPIKCLLQPIVGR